MIGSLLQKGQIVGMEMTLVTTIVMATEKMPFMLLGPIQASRIWVKLLKANGIVSFVVSKLGPQWKLEVDQYFSLSLAGKFETRGIRSCMKVTRSSAPLDLEPSHTDPLSPPEKPFSSAGFSSQRLG